MRELPDRPDMDQLRRQARALHRAATAGDGDALRRLQAVSLQPTLAAAQLTLAREHGYPSWARLKAEVERRRATAPSGYVIISLDELTRVFDFLGALATPTITHEDRRFPQLARRFPEDRSLMLVVENRDGRIVGGLLACRRGSAVTPRAIALEPGGPRGPRDELMTRLLQTLEIEARRLGADEIFEGGVGDDRSLYERHGYFRRNPMTRRMLPLPGRAREALLRSIANSNRGQSA